MANEQENKLTTGIDGLDSLFFGGIYNNNGHTAILVRGEHGVNKIHLAMQMCEGLNKNLENEASLSDDFKRKRDSGSKQDSEFEMVFISINKDMARLKNIYKGYHICRLIENIAIKKDNWKEDLDELLKSVEPKNPKPKNPKKGAFTSNDDLSKLSFSQLHSSYIKQQDQFYELQERFSSGLYYFNTRTLCLYEKRKINNQDIPIANLTEPADSKIQFIGKDDSSLTDGNPKIDSLTLFYNVLNRIEKIEEGKTINCIIIDGLSKLSANDIEQINFQALTESLKKKCKIAIITADNKLPISRIGTDIVIEMRISNDERMEYAYRELCITKCLYQRNVYGWHKYRMMNKGIEVFPSIHRQLAQRNYMDNAVSEATLPINEPSFPYWISEHKDPSEKLNYNSYKTNEGKTNPYEQLEEGKLLYISADSNLKKTIKTIIFHINYINKETTESSPQHHILFIDLKRSKKQFYETVHDILNKNNNITIKPSNIHFFSFRPGCIYPDEFLYTIKQQIDAIERVIKENHPELKDKYCDEFIHVVLGDITYIKYAYPCLENEKLLIPAIANLTRNRHMTNYIYYQKEEDQPFFIKQLKAVADEEIHN